MSKICAECKRELPLEVYEDYPKAKDGKHWLCPDCLEEGREELEEIFSHGQSYNRLKLRRYRAEDKPRYRAHSRKGCQRYRTRKAGGETTLTEAEWEQILADWGYSCAYCGALWCDLDSKLQREHVIPVSQGGDYTADNIVPACRDCNLKKHGRTPEQAGMMLRKITSSNNVSE